jgi:diaminohydroxyphosphoribosylaminopyrimidine deaminase/5-amino-6-(5-phosphoribosylamino)uracil reductase
MADKASLKYIKTALKLAEKGRGITSPNPMVGAVLVKNNRVLATGYHKGPGTLHAEAIVIKKAGKQAENSILYVNLEPCCHQGRTGPCTDLIIKSKVKKVVTSTKDPFGKVNGRGIRKLRQAGVEVELGINRKESWLLNDSYFSYHEKHRPFVILKLAQTLDGKIATVDGESKYISSDESQKFVHRLRASVDAVAIGSKTAILDNPSLTVRKTKGINPYRIVISRNLNLPDNLKLLNRNKDMKTIIASNNRSIKRYTNEDNHDNLIFWNIKNNDKRFLDINDFLNKANSFDIRSILIEGGAELASSFLKEKLIDKLIIVIAPKILGQGINCVNNIGRTKLSDALKFTSTSLEKYGDDWIFTGYPKWK